MSARTRVRRTKVTRLRSTRQSHRPKVVSVVEKNVPWRDVFKEQIDKIGEQAIYLRGARYREGLTQVELAMKTGIPQRHISEMENGKRPIGKKIANKLAEIFNVDYRLFL